MLYDIKNLNIWAEKPQKKSNIETQSDCDITELNLSQRSYNCLRRAGFNTIGDVLKLIENDEKSLRSIRNLGALSEAEILEKIREFESQLKPGLQSEMVRSASSLPIIRRRDVCADKEIWDSSIESFHLSNYALNSLKQHGITQVKDIYATNPKNEPGWYAVRELLEKIPIIRKDAAI